MIDISHIEGVLYKVIVEGQAKSSTIGTGCGSSRHHLIYGWQKMGAGADGEG